MNRVEKVLIGLAAIVGAVPGLAALASGFGSPPGSGALFGIGLEIIAAAAVAAVLLLRSRIREIPSRQAALLSVGGGVVSVVLLLTYFWAYDASVPTHDWYDEPTPVLVPLGVSSWSPARLDSLVACSFIAAPECRPVTDRYTAEQVAQAITKYGPDEILPLIPAGTRRAAISYLFTMYAVIVAALVFSFSIAAVRIAAEPD